MSKELRQFPLPESVGIVIRYFDEDWNEFEYLRRITNDLESVIRKITIWRDERWFIDQLDDEAKRPLEKVALITLEVYLGWC